MEFEFWMSHEIVDQGQDRNMNGWAILSFTMVVTSKTAHTFHEVSRVNGWYNIFLREEEKNVTDYIEKGIELLKEDLVRTVFHDVLVDNPFGYQPKTRNDIDLVPDAGDNHYTKRSENAKHRSGSDRTA